MASPDLTLPRPRTGVAERARAVATRVTARPELLALVALAAVLNLWALDINGYANEYYSAAVRSMTDNWHAFLFASFDSSGVMTVDKPPLAFWVQALSARAFGFSSWSILVPQALMGVASVALTYDLTRRVFGRWAGAAAGLALALTPIAVAISRHNNPDALLVLCSVGALWALVRGLEDGRTRWLLLSGALIGLGFETKMAAALTIVPGIVLAWLWIAPRGRRRAIGQLAGFGGVAAAVGLAWPVLVWLTPASDRPWVSGTSDNSIWSLIFGYNGLGRLFGQSGGPGGGNGGPPTPGGGGGGGMGGVFGGDTGPFRLLNSALGGQAGWLLGAAVVVAIALLVLTRLRRDDARSGWLIALGGAWLVTAVAFSRAEGIFHPYYVSLLAPFTAALFGAGVGIVVKGGVPARIVGPLMIVGGIVTSLVVIDQSATDMAWLRPVLIGGGLVVAIVLALGLHRRIRQTAIAAAIALMLFAPASWAVDTLGYATSSTFPAGGPSGSAMGMGGGPGGGGGGRFGGPGGGQGVPPSGGMNGGAPPAVAGGAAGSTTDGSGSSSSDGTGLPQGTTADPSGSSTTNGSSTDGTGLPPGTTTDPSSGSGNAGSGSSGSGNAGSSGTNGSGNVRGGMGGPGGGGGGGLGGGNTQTLTSALAYAKQHGGGVVAVSSQNGAASQLLTRDPTAQVAAIGGFSGRESQVTVDWLADAVESGRIRYVLSDGDSGGMGNDGRVGASDVLALAAQVGKAVSSVDGLYDLQGTADALRAAG